MAIRIKGKECNITGGTFVTQRGGTRAFIKNDFVNAFKNYVDNLTKVIEDSQKQEDIKKAGHSIAQVWEPAHKNIIEIFKNNNETLFRINEKESFKLAMEYLFDKEEFKDVSDQVKTIAMITNYFDDNYDPKEYFISQYSKLCA